MALVILTVNGITECSHYIMAKRKLQSLQGRFWYLISAGFNLYGVLQGLGVLVWHFESTFKYFYQFSGIQKWNSLAINPVKEQIASTQHLLKRFKRQNGSSYSVHPYKKGLIGKRLQ